MYNEYSPKNDGRRKTKRKDVQQSISMAVDDKARTNRPENNDERIVCRGYYYYCYYRYYDVLQCRRTTSSDWRDGHCACAYDRLKLPRRVFDRFVYDTITVLMRPPLK